MLTRTLEEADPQRLPCRQYETELSRPASTVTGPLNTVSHEQAKGNPRVDAEGRSTTGTAAILWEYRDPPLKICRSSLGARPPS